MAATGEQTTQCRAIVLDTKDTACARQQPRYVRWEEEKRKDGTKETIFERTLAWPDLLGWRVFCLCVVYILSTRRYRIQDNVPTYLLDGSHSRNFHAAGDTEVRDGHSSSSSTRRVNPEVLTKGHHPGSDQVKGEVQQEPHHLLHLESRRTNTYLVHGYHLELKRV